MKQTQTKQHESALALLCPQQEAEMHCFLSLASHELKTPITTMRTDAQLLLHRLSKQTERSIIVLIPFSNAPV